MEIKDIVVDLEIAKELKEKGWNQENSIYYSGDEGNEEFIVEGLKVGIALPTMEELLIKLSCQLNREKFEVNWFSFSFNSDRIYFCGYEIDTGTLVDLSDKKPCNVLAKMWIWSRDNRHLEAEDE